MGQENSAMFGWVARPERSEGRGRPTNHALRCAQGTQPYTIKAAATVLAAAAAVAAAAVAAC
jgi:hypothetical protein